MPARLVILPLLLSLCILPACGGIRVKGPFANDPLTGGVDTASSRLLGISLPAGMQLYSSHGFMLSDSMTPTGLEVLRGEVDTDQAAQHMHTGLQSQGWHLRMNIRKGRRLTQVYDNGQELSVLHFRPQVAFTIMEIWRGTRLENGAGNAIFTEIPFGGTGDTGSSDGLVDIPGETFLPLQDEPPPAERPKPGHVESWGDGPIQEREL